MSVTLNEFAKAGFAESRAQEAARPNGLPGKQPGNPNVFQTLLNLFKPDEGAAPAGGLRNKPPSSRVIGALPTEGEGLNSVGSQASSTNSVNTMAASALIALHAISSARGCLERFCRHSIQPSGGLSPPGSSAAGVEQTNGGAAGAQPGTELGYLAGLFESGEGGPGTIGYDPRGGTSYGTFQISSKAGTMKLFIDYLSQNAPDLARKLEAAGPANTGCRAGAMPRVWKELAANQPVRFEKLQSDFIAQNLYQPTVKEISDRTGLDVSKAPKALQEVLWSTAVQHGSKGAANIFIKAIGTLKGQSDQGGMARLIDTVYNMRAGRFTSSGPGIRAAAVNRFKMEGRMALAMLSSETSTGNIG